MASLGRRLPWLLGLMWCTGCGARATSARPVAGNGGAEIDVPRPSAPPPSWPPGLKPCSADDTEGEGCAAGPPKAPQSPTPGSVTPSTVWKVPVGPDDPVRGPPDAPVTLVVFSDFECPFCKHALPTFERLLEELPNDVRVVWKDLPLPMHPHAEAAAEFARAVRAEKGDAGFWAAHDALYAAQAKLGDPAFERIAKKLGVPWPRARASMRAARYGNVIQADVDLSDRVEVPATPTTFVNGQKLVGVKSYEKTRALVDTELKKARALEKSGTPRAQIYAHIMESGVQIAPKSDVPQP